MRAAGRPISLGFLLLFCGLSILAQPYRFRHLTIEDGLSQSSVNCIMQDRHGFLWFGTQDGLNLFDGYRFQVFRKDSTDARTLSHNWIWDVFEDRKGDFWIATWQGLTRYDPCTGRFERFLPDSSDPNAISGERPSSICQDRRGNIWLGIWGGGLDRYDPHTGGFIRYLPDLHDKRSLPSVFVRYVFVDSKDRLWAGTWRGLALARLQQDSITGFVRFQHISNDPTSLGGDQVMCILEDHEGVIWVGTRGGGLNRFNEKDSTFTRYQNRKEDPTSLSGNDVCVLYEDSQQRLWVGTFTEGLNLFDRGKGTFLRIYQDPDDPSGLLRNNVYSIGEDASGLLWVGAGGLNILDPRMNSFGYYRHQYNSEQSLSMNKVTAVCEESPARLWIGTEGAGVNLFDVRKGRFTVFRNDPGDPRSLRGNNISSVACSGDGKIWIGIRGKGLDCYLTEKGIFRHITRIHGLDSPEAFLYINDMCFTSKDTLWLATENAGVIRYILSTGEGVAFYTANPQHPFPGNSLLTLRPGKGGKLWLGTWGIGLYGMDRKSGNFSFYPLDAKENSTLAGTIVHVIREVTDKKGITTLWVGTGNGLFRLRTDVSGKMQIGRITTSDGLPSNVIYGILCDDRGEMWITTNNGLCRYNPVTGNTRTFDRSDGLQSNEFNGHICLKLQDGRLFFGGSNGFNLFSPEKIRVSNYQPPVVLTAFRVFNRDMDFGRALTEVKKIDLTWKQNFFAFEFAALDYAQPQKIQYAYKMEGVDQDWVYSGNRRYASYTRIDPGDYVFRVKATNRDGIWSKKILALDVHVRPPFWRTWWFKALAGLLFLLFLYSLHRMQLEKLLAVERLRVRIASDLHDDVGSALTRISISSEQMQVTKDPDRRLRLSKAIGTISREIIATMSDIIWSIDARNDTLVQLTDRMQDFAFSAFSMSNIKMQFVQKGMRKKKKIPVDKRQNIFYFFKEVINNIVRHAEATEVNIYILNTEKGFMMEISDNGKGFDPDQIRIGNGLRNIQMRAQRLNAKLDIQHGNGTTIKLQMKKL